MLASTVAATLLAGAAAADANTTYCWGNGQFGTLGNGNGTGNNYVSPLPTPVLGNLSFATVSAGYQHVCALTGGGKAYCWVRWAAVSGKARLHNFEQSLGASDSRA